MQVLLRIANGKSNVRKVRLHSDTTIGRSPECQLKVASNQISRRHCQIVIREALVAIKDLGSANGTFVNGRKVPAEVEIPLTPGTRVMLGPLHFTVEYELPGMEVAVPVVTEEEEVDTAALVLDSVDGNGQDPEPEESMETIEQPSPFRDAVEIPRFAPPQPVSPSEPQPLPAHIASPQPAVQPVAAPIVAGVVAAAAWQAPAPMSVTPVAGLGDTAYSSPPVPAAPVAPAEPVAPALPVAAVVKTAVPITPATPVAAAPEVFPGMIPAEEVPEPDDGSFNFGIFAASGSGVVVESAPELPVFAPPDASISASQVTPASPPKPAKKGFLQMLGWGKKKAVSPAPEPPAAPITTEPAADDVSEEPALMEPAEEVAPAETPAEGSLSFELPGEAEESDDGDGAEDEALKNFFNNFK